MSFNSPPGSSTVLFNTAKRLDPWRDLQGHIARCLLFLTQNAGWAGLFGEIELHDYVERSNWQDLQKLANAIFEAEKARKQRELGQSDRSSQSGRAHRSEVLVTDEILDADGSVAGSARHRMSISRSSIEENVATNESLTASALTASGGSLPATATLRGRTSSSPDPLQQSNITISVESAPTYTGREPEDLRDKLEIRRTIHRIYKLHGVSRLQILLDRVQDILKPEKFNDPDSRVKVLASQDDFMKDNFIKPSGVLDILVDLGFRKSEVREFQEYRSWTPKFIDRTRLYAQFLEEAISAALRSEEQSNSDLRRFREDNARAKQEVSKLAYLQA
ncbi:hypothetical protein PQX77_022052 [Marasmius sp. AFHP31]|nr:hypothetical protein PQX77_022052 [Marasmius sp. AFHP31]